MNKTLHEKFKAVQEINAKVSIPWHVMCILSAGEIKEIEVVGNQISLGSDFASLEEVRVAVAWYVEQLGGTVKWSK